MITAVGQAPPRTVVITGATDGLGRALARVLAARGDRLILLGRRPLVTLDDPLFNVATYCEVDLAMPDCADVLDRFLRERGITAVDLAIQNAGVGSYGPVADQSPERIEELLRVNLHGPLALTYALLPALWRARGTLVFIGSVAASLPVPQYAVYGATKAALEGFARSLRIELAGQVAVRVFHPGAIRTALHAKSGMPLTPAVARRYPPPERVAAQIMAALERGPLTMALGPANRALRFAGRHGAPVVDALARSRQRRAGSAVGGGTPLLLVGKHCVITGAADGIGRALAHAFGTAGYRITGIDRDEALSARTHAELTARGIQATFLHADLTERADVARIVADVAAEALYLEARWASLVPYAAAAGLLADVLPVASGANATTLRQHVLRVAERAEGELGKEQSSFIDGCPAQWAELPTPEGRIVVGLDGGYVRDWDDRKANFELIVGRSMPEDRAPRYVGLVHGYDQKPKRRLFEVMRQQGLQANQDVTFLTDGGEEVRSLTELVTPEAEHVLDWFHIAMRLTVLEQYARGVAHHDEKEGARLLRELGRTKWLLWHGNGHRARQHADDLRDDVKGMEMDYPHLGKFARSAHEFAVYVRSNAGSLINYGERFRSGERISSAMAESTVNAVVSKRFA